MAYSGEKCRRIRTRRRDCGAMHKAPHSARQNRVEREGRWAVGQKFSVYALDWRPVNVRGGSNEVNIIISTSTLQRTQLRCTWFG